MPIPIAEQKWPLEVAPAVAVRVLTYNHESYIRECLDSILMQKTVFPVRIVVFDDCSTDRTAKIVKEYQSNYPDLFTVFFQDENTYGKKIRTAALKPWYETCYDAKYAAICEGDDYWLDSNKLQAQFDCLEQNLNVDMSIHSAIKLNCLTDKQAVMGKYSDTNTVINTEDVIKKKYGQIPTASTFVRVSVLKRLYAFRENQKGLTVGDIYLHFFGALRGGAYYINKPMSLYREFVSGSFTLSQQQDADKKIAHIRSRVKAYQYLNKHTNYKHNKAIKVTIKKPIKDFLKDSTVPRTKRLSIFKKYSVVLGKDKVFYFFLVHIPWFLESLRLAKNAVRKKIK